MEKMLYLNVRVISRLANQQISILNLCQNFYCLSTLYDFSLQFFYQKGLLFAIKKYTFAPAFEKGLFAGY